MHYSFYDRLFHRNFKMPLESELTKMLAMKDENGLPPFVEQRKEMIEVLFNSFVNQTGKSPDGVQVQRLANWLHLETLTDMHPDKVTREEYPIMNKRQLRSRHSREMMWKKRRKY